MKLSEAIAKLQEAKEKHGDLEFSIFDDDGTMEEVEPHFSFKQDLNKKIIGITLCDVETASAFL